MDHNLDESMNMESIESMEFDHSGVVVNQEDIALEEDSQEGNMAMELGIIEEQPSLLESGHEEIIVPDFMTSDQFGFQEFTMQGDNSTGANITIATNDLNEFVSQNEQTGIQLANKTTTANIPQHNIITIKALPQPRMTKKVTSSFPKQVAIAPKPMKGAPNVQYAIAPKPVTLVMNKTGKATLKNVQSAIKGNVLTQIGKQLVMVPATGTGQKIKFTSILQPSSSTEQSVQIPHVVSTKPANMPVKAKLIIQGSKPAADAAVITKLVPAPRYVMQQTTVPISIAGNKMVLKTPPKSANAGAKTQILSFQTPNTKVVTSQANVTTKKVLITSNPSQNVIIKATGTKTVNAQTLKNTSVVQNQRTQLHPINVPGKGIQFIKLVTNQPTAQKAVTKPAPIAVSSKNFVLTDSEGNIIQMTDKLLSGQPSPLVLNSATTVNTSNAGKVLPKMKRLVRIAPITSKAETATVTAARSSQSLLAPIEPSPTITTVTLEEYNNLVEQNKLQSHGTGTATSAENAEPEQTIDIKPTLASLISDAVADTDATSELAANVSEVEIEYDGAVHKHEQFEDQNSNSYDHSVEHEQTIEECVDRSTELGAPEAGGDRAEENVIIVPSVPDMQQHDSCQDESYVSNGDQHETNERHENMETDLLRLLSPQVSHSYSDTPFYENKTDTPEVRPRKACNCTKSQCLKLYCECFANGEFCNRCNCNNCHNNLDSEEFRQKAIRACLERNPNAFRPKIGKGKIGGPEIIRRHNKGCNCKRSGCLKNYCECYEAKIACTLMCKCVGCRNVQETMERRRFATKMRDRSDDSSFRPSVPVGSAKQPCSFITTEVIDAVTQCMLASVAQQAGSDPVEEILLEFSRCMTEIISASHQAL